MNMVASAAALLCVLNIFSYYDVITMDALTFCCEGIYYEAFYRHVESNRGTSMIFETVSSLLAHR